MNISGPESFEICFAIKMATDIKHFIELLSLNLHRSDEETSMWKEMIIAHVLDPSKGK